MCLVRQKLEDITDLQDRKIVGKNGRKLQHAKVSASYKCMRQKNNWTRYVEIFMRNMHSAVLFYFIVTYQIFNINIHHKYTCTISMYVL